VEEFSRDCRFSVHDGSAGASRRASHQLLINFFGEWQILLATCDPLTSMFTANAALILKTMTAQRTSTSLLVRYNSSKSSWSSFFLRSPPQPLLPSRRRRNSRWCCVGTMCIPLYALMYSFTLQHHLFHDAFGGDGAITMWTASMEYKPIANNKTRASKRTSTYQHTQEVPVARQPKQQHRHNLPETHKSGLQFIHSEELRQKDYFSDSWLINRQRFLEINVERIGIVEDAAFAAVGETSRRPHSYSKMTYDWMDFAVEHLSKWWGVLQVLRGGDPGKVGLLERYTKERVTPPSNSSKSPLPPLSKTIAMVAFAPYKGRLAWHDPTGAKGRRLTSFSLAATVASLYQVGFGRVVVVSVNTDDMSYVMNTVDVLSQIYGGSTTNNGQSESKDNNLCRLGSTKMEIAFVHVTDPDWISNGIVERNVPRAAMVGLRLAMTRKLNTTETTKWLGRHKNVVQHWNYVYLTEPDTILHIRRELLPQFQAALQDGISLFPHRLHPLPHETDLPRDHTMNRGLYIPNVGHFANISVIDTSTSTTVNTSQIQQEASAMYISCCDDGKSWPGFDGWERKDGCRPWWTCGFHSIESNSAETYNETGLLEKHERLQLYPMMVSC
jgi:hypothetical protein